MIDYKILFSAFFCGLAVAFMAADLIQNNTVLFFTFN